MTGHTPGPWADIRGYIVVRGGHTLASVNSHNTSEGKANARLIAAAPDLLKAAQILSAMGDASIASDIKKALRPHEVESFDQAVLAARAALGKAEGR